MKCISLTCLRGVSDLERAIECILDRVPFISKQLDVHVQEARHIVSSLEVEEILNDI